MKRVLTSILVSSMAVNAVAEGDKTFKTDAELGALLTSGNTESTSIKAKLDVKQELTQWRNSYVLEGLYKEDTVDISATETEDQTSAERYALAVQSDYKLNEEHRGLFIFAGYEEDRFSGYDYQGSVAAGYTDRLFKKPNSHLNYSVGLGMSFSKTDEVFVDEVLTQESVTDESAIIRVSLNYLYQFSDYAKFTQTLSSDIATESEANTKTKAESAVTANLNNAFAIKASFSVNHNSEVPENKENTDTQTALTLVYSF